MSVLTFLANRRVGFPPKAMLCDTSRESYPLT